MKDLQKIKEFFSKPLKEERDIYDEIANEEFGMDYDQLGPNEKEWVRDEISNMDEAMTTAYESVKEGNHNAEDFKPYIVKDRNNPNFLKVFIQYPAGTGFTTALGQRTMTGQDREYGVAKAMKIGQAVVAKLESQYNIEDIDVYDNEDGKVIVFAVSDDFIKMNTPSINEAKDPDHLEKVRNIANALPHRYNVKPNMGMVKVTSRSKDELTSLKTELAKANLYSEMRPTLAGMFELTVLDSPINENLNPEVINKVNRFIKALANHYDYSEQDAVYAIMQALRTTNFQGINEARNSPINTYKVGDILKFKDGEDWKVMKVKDNVDKLVIKPHNEKAKEGNVSLEIDIDADYLKKNLLEAKEEDAVDTITMDIPLFLRMLEYAREDAKQDLDLHDVTEKANKLGKERGILQMDDYEEIVGTAEEIKEEQLSFINKARAKSSLRQFLSGKRDDGMGKFDAIVYGIDTDGKKHQIKYYNDLQNYEKFALGDNPNIKEGMGGELDEPFFIRVSVRDARKAMDVFNDIYRNSNIKTYGSDVYAADDVSDIYDFFYDLNSQGIEILDANVDEEDYDYDSEYEKTLGENVAPDHDGKAAPYGSGYKPLEERIAKALDRINEDLCPAGKAYIKRRQAAGEKSSAYLSGRGVKVCKGQMSGRAKKKK
jgi:hypothetical protein